ncbi:DEAD/DEAH box helicase [Opitutia bacterium ISCC 51]|nr:DEAD/DEAH box helicase [Opitutae bacterium ISCC 51]QXD28437.1 DEAD/DEAH box helicase [Opitutae bacterium ISCC 52]
MAEDDSTTESPEKQNLDDHAFAALGLSHKVVRAVANSGYENPTNIQSQAIPVVLEGRDVIGSSQTGTGKTAAFALPVISNLKKHGKLRCLVLEPTRELADQVTSAFRTYGKFTNLKTALIQGGVGYGRQIEMLNKGVDVVVATPGRLLDLHKQKNISFKDIEVVVLDEVDRMLDMGFLPDVKRIVKLTPRKRQTLFFSATIPSEIEYLAQWSLTNPFTIDVGQRRSAAETVNHCLYPVAREQKMELLLRLLDDMDYQSVLIFTERKLDAEVVARKMELNGHEAVTLHSDRSQRERKKALDGFKSGDFEILIATDVAGRGLDISGISHVVNYDVPRNAENYVHRIGRTGRANTEGDAITLFAADEMEQVKGIEGYIEQEIERVTIENFEYAFTTLLQKQEVARPVRRGRNRGYVPANTMPFNMKGRRR